MSSAFRHGHDHLLCRTPGTDDDESGMTHYLTWQEARVEWEPVGAGATRVTWTLRYRRDLDPAWYFGPMERLAAARAADYLIDSVATP